MALRDKQKLAPSGLVTVDLKITHYFAAFELVRNDSGEIYQDDEDAVYLRPHRHKLFRDESGNPVEYVSPMEIHQAIRDEAISSPSGFVEVGELIILEKFHYTKGPIVEVPTYKKVDGLVVTEEDEKKFKKK